MVPASYTRPISDLGFEKNMVFVWPSPYPALNPSPHPTPLQEKKSPH